MQGHVLCSISHLKTPLHWYLKRGLKSRYVPGVSRASLTLSQGLALLAYDAAVLVTGIRRVV
eukprot:1926455-Rhodomonas_salina.4